jgi:hypothetical protein
MVDLHAVMTYFKNMKYNICFLSFGLFALSFSASLQAAEVEPAEEKVIPTEISEPPYEVGNLVTEQGYYIERDEDQTSINVRIVGNKLRLYWIDADGLIAEPEASVATVRLTGSVRGRPYHRLNRLSDDAGLGAPGFLPPPHLFNVILVIENPESDDPVTHTFRYVPAFDKAVDPTVSSESESKAQTKY